MEFKSVKIVDSEEKSTQEIEQDLVAKHEKEQGIEQNDGVEKIVLKQEVSNPDVTSEEEEVNTPVELDDESVLSHIRKKFGREELSYDDLLQKEIVEKELSEDIEALRKYKQETGRGIEDFVKLNRNLDNESPDAMIAEYILSENPEFDEEDVAFEMEREFSYDDDLDDENITFKVSDINATKEVQSNAGNFVNKHLDENGMLKDANAYHKALNAAMDPDALFKFAYEKGAADAITKDVKEAKNVDMRHRRFH